MLPNWPRAHFFGDGEPPVTAVLREQADDFQVEELLDVELSGSGEFTWLWLEKRDETTERVARLVARHAGVGPRAVSWSGLKDRHALTRQWFSVHLPGKPDPDWQALNGENIRILGAQRHSRKLRTGTHSGNRFVLRLRHISGDQQTLLQQLSLIGAGVPNYFGEQRFGRDATNVETAQRWFAGDSLSGENRAPPRFERGLYLSAARSWLFNQVLAQRVRDGSWNQALPGDVFSLRDSGSLLREVTQEELATRLATGDIHPTGPLFGRGGRQPDGAAGALEQQVLAREPQLCAGLLQHGLEAQRRALRVLPQELFWEFDSDSELTLGFRLPRGCFATTVVRELVRYRQ